jgi:hypothetical protein
VFCSLADSLVGIHLLTLSASRETPSTRPASVVFSSRHGVPRTPRTLARTRLRCVLLYPQRDAYRPTFMWRWRWRLLCPELMQLGILPMELGQHTQLSCLPCCSIPGQTHATATCTAHTRGLSSRMGGRVPLVTLLLVGTTGTVQLTSGLDTRPPLLASCLPLVRCHLFLATCFYLRLVLLLAMKDRLHMVCS